MGSTSWVYKISTYFCFLFQIFFPTVRMYLCLYGSMRIRIVSHGKEKIDFSSRRLKQWHQILLTFHFFFKRTYNHHEKKWNHMVIYFSCYCRNIYWSVLTTFPISKKHLLLFENIDYIIGTICVQRLQCDTSNDNPQNFKMLIKIWVGLKVST